MSDVEPEPPVLPTDNRATRLPGLIDVRVEPFSILRDLSVGLVVRGTAVTVALSIVLAVPFWFLQSILGLPMVVPWLVFVSAMFVFVLVHQSNRQRHIQQRIVSRLEKKPDEPIVKSVTDILLEALQFGRFGRRHSHMRRGFERATWSAARGISGLTDGLVKAHRFGLTLRACTPESGTEIQPIEVPIEPLPLDESVPFVHALGADEEHDFDGKWDRATTGANTSNLVPTSEESLFRRKLKRNITLRGGRWLFAFFFVIWAAQAVQAIIVWRVTFGLVLWTWIVVTFLVGLGGGGAWRSRQQWLIVPGGLIARTPNRRGTWRVHLFDRRTSVLCTYRRTRNHWFVCVADRDTHQKAVVTPTESLALLRAWLSPLPPPPREQLGELAE